MSPAEEMCAKITADMQRLLDDMKAGRPCRALTPFEQSVKDSIVPAAEPPADWAKRAAEWSAQFND